MPLTPPPSTTASGLHAWARAGRAVVRDASDLLVSLVSLRERQRVRRRTPSRHRG
jgi:hypothetical protein